MNEVRRILLYENIRNNTPLYYALFAALESADTGALRWSKHPLTADFVLIECVPALAFVILFANDMITTGIKPLLPRLEKVSANYKNSFCILVGGCTQADDETLWMDLNIQCPAGTLRLVFVESIPYLAQTVVEIFKAMNSEKVAFQRAYFDSARDNIASYEVVQRCVADGLSRLEIDQGDISAVMQALPSLRAIVNVATAIPTEEFIENVPISRDTAEKLQYFFK